MRRRCRSLSCSVPWHPLVSPKSWQNRTRKSGLVPKHFDRLLRPPTRRCQPSECFKEITALFGIAFNHGLLEGFLCLGRSCCCESIDSSMSLTECCVWVIRVSVESTCDETVSIARGDVEKGDQRRSIPELAAVIVSGCPRTKFRILAGNSRDPMGGIERSEGPHESAAAIGCNHRHEVHVVAKKL